MAMGIGAIFRLFIILTFHQTDCSVVISQDALEIIEHRKDLFKISGNLSHANRTTKVLNLSFCSAVDMENMTLMMTASLWMGNQYVPFKSIKYSVMVTQLLEFPFYDIPLLVHKSAHPPMVPPLKPNVTYNIENWNPTSFPNFPNGRWLARLDFFTDIKEDVLVASLKWYFTMLTPIEWRTTTQSPEDYDDDDNNNGDDNDDNNDDSGDDNDDNDDDDGDEVS